MGEKGITIMELKVDLQCRRCYKKVKKVLCKFPQIHDQIYDEKNNTVRIKVVCCCPEEIMQKIRCKGGNCIMCIKIVPPPPPPPPLPSQRPPPPPKPPCEVPVLVLVCPLVYAIGVCCTECSEGVSGGPCFQGHGQPRPCSVGYGLPVCDSYGGGWHRGCYVSRCDYFCEEYSPGCTVM
ncbi:heavy metal-associated isoprenylated plant protein 43-like [Corylus avellana]|uniref:heavy metal-associated isoprenylated plant protein 43-like n=1 Tax=Corylus avellana TaxID=13451 RepID=UPI00286BCF2E|nr:heavy metal-associated isoprenylated plant protein 43-like [Corylus avellana]